MPSFFKPKPKETPEEERIFVSEELDLFKIVFIQDYREKIKNEIENRKKLLQTHGIDTSNEENMKKYHLFVKEILGEDFVSQLAPNRKLQAIKQKLPEKLKSLKNSSEYKFKKLKRKSKSKSKSKEKKKIHRL